MNLVFAHCPELWRRVVYEWSCVCDAQVSESGIHRPHVAGIHGRSNDGAYSLVLAGGYEDDVVRLWFSLKTVLQEIFPFLLSPMTLSLFRTMVTSSPTRVRGVVTSRETRGRPSSPAIRSSPTWTGQRTITLLNKATWISLVYYLELYCALCSIDSKQLRSNKLEDINVAKMKSHQTRTK